MQMPDGIRYIKNNDQKKCCQINNETNIYLPQMQKGCGVVVDMRIIVDGEMILDSYMLTREMEMVILVDEKGNIIYTYRFEVYVPRLMEVEL